MNSLFSQMLGKTTTVCSTVIHALPKPLFCQLLDKITRNEEKRKVCTIPVTHARSKPVFSQVLKIITRREYKREVHTVRQSCTHGRIHRLSIDIIHRGCLKSLTHATMAKFESSHVPLCTRLKYIGFRRK